MKKEERELVKHVLRFLKIARSPASSIVTYRAMMSGNKFKDAVILPLEHTCGWTEEDEEEVQKAAQEFYKKTHGHTIKETGENLIELLKQNKWWMVGIGGAAIVSGVAYHIIKKKNNDNVKNTEK